MIAPVMPTRTGNGLAMRAAMSLDALSRHYRTSLLVLPRYPSPGVPAVPETVERACVVPPSIARRGVEEVAAYVATSDSAIFDSFDVLHLFRLAAVDAATPWIGRTSQIHLDLDDVESQSRKEIAALHRQRGETALARLEEESAKAALTSEIDALLRLDRMYVASPADIDRLPLCGRAAIRVLPNAVELPEPAPAIRPRGGVFPLLFIGTLGYAPNADAVFVLAREILPILRERAPGAFRVTVAGHGATPAIRALDGEPDIDVVGPVDEVGPHYAAAGCLVAPLRAGSGTRIKILEAMAHGTPVVSSAKGIEGIAAQDGVHALLADTPEGCAEACLRLRQHPDLGLRLSDAALDLVRRNYSLEAMIEAVSPGR
jgi:glycosyltransferase involved in cell wall biosynthesis